MIEVGSILDGKVIRITDFGAFVDLGANKSGLVHISEVAQHYVRDVNEELKLNDKVKVKVIGIDEKGRISLSIKQAAPPAPSKRAEDKKNVPKRSREAVRPADIDWGARASAEMSFEDKLTRFRQDSDEKMQALRRSADSKRSGGYSRRGGRSF